MFAALFDTIFNRTPGPDAFARRFLDALRAQGWQEEMVHQPDQFRLVGASGFVVYLHNAYHAYLKANRRHRAHVLQHYVSGFVAEREESRREKPFEELRPTLMPLLRNRGMLEELRLEHVLSHGVEVPFGSAWRDVAEDCVELLALDLPETTSTLVAGPPAAWGLTLDESLLIARGNLRDATTDQFVEVAPGVFRGAWQDAYDSSRALLPDVLHRVPVAGQPVFMMPTRDCLLVVGDRDAGAMSIMLELSLEAAEAGRCISSLAFAYEDRRIVPFTLPTREHRQRQADLRRMLDAPAYHRQKELLDRIHQARDEDIFVAAFLVHADPDEGGCEISLGTWTDGVDTLLPVTDRIALVSPRDGGGADVKIVEWQQAAAVCAELMERQPTLYPPRYRVRAFPDDAQLRQLTPVGWKLTRTEADNAS